MIVVAIAGGFDPLHIGHLDHIRKAKVLGDILIAIINPDEDMIRKKGYVFMPLEERREILQAIRYVDSVVVATDKDGTVAHTLELIRPTIFAKGGDRTPENMPSNEIEVCRKINCKIMYGIGDKINSSSEIIRKFQKANVHFSNSA